MWPQWIVIVLMLLNVGVVLGKFGEPKRDRYDVGDLIAGAIFAGLLYWGGFFAHLGG